jgi:hypothetical protein
MENSASLVFFGTRLAVINDQVEYFCTKKSELCPEVIHHDAASLNGFFGKISPL